MLQDTFQPLEKKFLAYEGKYYPTDMEFEIRGAGVKEIRKWVNLDENSPESITQHVIDIISNCVRVKSVSGENQYSYKDIYEHDKIPFLLAIHQVSFVDDERRLYVKGKCSGPMACGKEFPQLAIQVGNLRFREIPEKFDKYFDKDLGMFHFQTKNLGDIDFKFSTIGVGTIMYPWMSSFQPQFIRDNQQMFRLVQSLVTDWRGLTSEKLRKLQVEEYNIWDGKRLGFQTSLVAECNDEILDTLKYTCPDCGATFFPAMAIIGGFKSMFTPVSSVDDELV